MHHSASISSIKLCVLLWCCYQFDLLHPHYYLLDQKLHHLYYQVYQVHLHQSNTSTDKILLIKQFLNFQVLIVGNGVVGKSSMIQRYCRGTFTKSYKKTIGVDFLEKQLRVLGEDVRLMLWDTAGQEEFDALTRSYYRGAQACVVAFSTTDRDSLLAVRKWRRKVEDECGDIPMVLVQNKLDLIAQSEINQ